MMSRNLTPSGVSPSASPLMSSLNETIDVSGVRSSCDTMARNWFLASSSLRSRSFCSASWRWASSRCWSSFLRSDMSQASQMSPRCRPSTSTGQ